MFCEKITLKNGEIRWQCAADGPPDPVTGKRKQIWRRAKTKKEAAKRVQEAIRSLEEDGIDQRVRKKITFEQAATEWLDTYKLTGVKNSTVRIREKEIKILNRYFAKAPISNITHAAYQKMINAIAKQYARTTVQGVNTTCGMIFKKAIKEKLIKDNPQDGVVIPKRRRTIEEIERDPIEEKYLEREELEGFLRAVREHGLDLDLEWFYLLAFSGMRSGELLALKWSDINFDTNEIRITKTLYNPDNNMKNYELTPPKTEGSIRTISMEKEIMELLKSHHRRQKKVRLKYRSEIEDFHDSNFVFCRTNGYPFIQKNIITRMSRLLDYTEIKKKATPHIFRHTYISMATEAGVDLATIMEKVGHEDMKTTMKIYTHVTNKMKQGATEKVSFMYKSALENIKISTSR